MLSRSSGLLAAALIAVGWGTLYTAMPANATEGAFSADRAWADLVAQCAFGPRDPGGTGHAVALSYLTRRLEEISKHVSKDSFWGAKDGQPVRLTNLEARIGPPGLHPLLICAHWDTRPWADQDPDPAMHDRPILGADDGASGVAVALEVARAARPHVPVEIALFDGEDLGRDLATFFQGSRRFAARGERPRAAILLDMVGHRGLRIPREELSQQSDPVLLDRVFATARRLGSEFFVDAPGETVYDDHYPLIQAGIPAIDLVDLNYPAWHTIYDTPDHCDKRALAAVGQVVVDVVDAER